jgi:tRNA pseudouridine55 synthase
LCASHDLSGILVVDKPAGVSSAAVVGKIKRLLQVKKVGHTGTLDPFATGVLVCCVGKATRLAYFLLKCDKTYEGVLYLGVSTDTQDKTGTAVCPPKEAHFSLDEISQAMKRFEGAIEQKPPVYSALKDKGVPLYRLAREGRPVQKPARQVLISSIRIADVCLPEIRFEVTCSSGTYIRTLCADIGEYLGCGGHLKELRRTQCGGFSIRQAVSLQDVAHLAASGGIENRIVDMKEAVPEMPECVVNRAQAEKVKKGVLLTRQDFGCDNMPDEEGFVRIIDADNRLIAIVQKEKGSEHYHYCCVLAQ